MENERNKTIEYDWLPLVFQDSSPFKIIKAELRGNKKNNLWTLAMQE